MPIHILQNFEVFFQPNPNDSTKTDIRVKTGHQGLFSGGIALELDVGLDAELSSKVTTPPPNRILVKALVDTGCTITTIDQSLILKLGLATRGYAETFTANGQVKTSQHFVSINFPGTLLKSRPVHLVHALNLSGQRYQALIGRDIMSQWAIHYNGPSGFISISE